MKKAPIPPVGAYGERFPDPEPPPLPRNAQTRGVDGRLEPVLGGAAAGWQAGRVVRRTIERLRRFAEVDDLERRKRAYWSRVEGRADESMKDALSRSVGPRDDESDEEYDARLTAIFENLRLRLDAQARFASPSFAPAPASAAPASAPAQAGSADGPIATMPTGPSATNALPPAPPTLTLLRREAKAIRSEFYRRNRRKPTAAEWDALVRDYRGKHAPRP